MDSLTDRDLMMFENVDLSTVLRLEPPLDPRLEEPVPDCSARSPPTGTLQSHPPSGRVT